MKDRLQKLIAAAGLASRREAERWIEDGRVTVNGRTASIGERADLSKDRVEIDGKRLRSEEEKICLILNKPTGYVTTLKDPQGRPSVADLVKKIPVRLFPVGRLDLNTEGLLLMTNDGELSHRLTHPRHQVEKTYLVRVRGVLSEDDKRRLETGVMLEDGKTAPARVDHVRIAGSHTWFHLTIREGRNRQVRRMCDEIGHPVSRLKRIRVAFLELGDIPQGRFRQLSPQEVNRLKKL